MANATGKRIQELPLTPPRVLELMLERVKALEFPHVPGEWKGNVLSR